jgi:chromosomal replication initiator protein
MIEKLSAPQAFAEALAHTRGRSPASFENWFSGVQFDDLTDGVLTLRARDEFVQDWVSRNFLPALIDRLRELTGWSIQVAWLIDPKLTRPLAEGPAVAPVQPKPISTRSPGDVTAARTPPTLAPAGRAQVPALRSPFVTLEDLNPKQTFASFVVGPSNQLAHAAAIAAAGGGGRRYNPLFICGGTGLGKTHLMQAIAHRMLSDRPGARILSVSAERFTNEFIHAIQHHKMDDFRARYRTSCDLLLVDDIQFLAGREQTQEEFFHTFNALHSQDRQIVVTSDKYPQNLERMEERLVSRFSWGLVADVQVPELETRVAIVRNKAAIEGIDLEDEVALYLAQVVRSNVRELEGTLIRLAAKSSLTGRAVDLAFAKAELAHSVNHRAQSMSVEDVQRLVCHHFHIRSSDLVSKDRHKTVAFARHVAMYLCKQRLKCSFPELGRAFGNRDHTTVMSAVRKIEAQRDVDPQVRAHLEALEKKLADG